MKPYSYEYPEDEQKHLPQEEDDKGYAPTAIEIVLNVDDSSIPQPKYHKIIAEYLPAQPLNPHSYFKYAQFFSEFDPDNPIVLHSISKGAPATENDQTAIRQHQVNQANAQSRRLNWTYMRKLQGFVCLNICYLIVLLISINSNFSDYRKYQFSCPNYSKTNLFFAIIGAAWILVSISGVYGATKRIEKVMHYYTGGLYGILIITVIITAFGLLVGDSAPSCGNTVSKTVPIVGTALFTLFVVGLFAYIVTKLRRMLIALTIGQPSQPRQATQQTEQAQPIQPRAPRQQTREQRHQRRL